jgi:hypothetical protein
MAQRCVNEFPNLLVTARDADSFLIRQGSGNGQDYRCQRDGGRSARA